MFSSLEAENCLYFSNMVGQIYLVMLPHLFLIAQSKDIHCFEEQTQELPDILHPQTLSRSCGGSVEEK